MSKPKTILVNPQTKAIEQAYEGFSFPAVLFTPIWCVIKGLNAHAIISLLLAFTGFGLVYWLIAGALGNDWHYQSLIRKGYVPAESEIVSKNESKIVKTDQEKAVDNIEKISRLKQLLNSGAITENEFNEKKKKLLENI